MADVNVTPGRHRRQRSSVTIKKRVSHTHLNDAASATYSVPDNALSSPKPPQSNKKAIAAIRDGDTGDHKELPSGLLFRPANSAAMLTTSSQSSTEIADQYYQSSGHTSDIEDQENAHGHSRISSGLSETYQLRDATTRVEPDLFGEEDSASELSSLSTSVTSANGPLQASTHRANQDPSQVLSPNSATTPKMHSYDFVEPQTTPAPRTGASQRRLPLTVTTEGSVLTSSSSPRTSPRALRMQASSSQSTSGTPRSARRVKRMSLGYFANGPDLASNSPVLSGSGFPLTPPVTSSSTASQGVRSIGASAPRSASVSTTASIESASKAVSLSEGETILSQDKDILARIAEKERAILEMRETLAKEEKELKLLKREWQRSAQLKIATIAPSMSEKAGHSTLADPKSSATDQTTAIGGTDTLRGNLARLQSNVGTQINAFLDQLVPISPQMEQDKPLTEDVRNAEPQSVVAVPENREHAVVGDAKANFSTTKNATANRAEQGQSDALNSQQTKRGSVFATSFAAFQKQMEKQLSSSLGGEASAQSAAVGTESGWSGWQKRLKEARDNASDLLAKAEARIGQVMALEDIAEVHDPDTKSLNGGMSRSTSANAFEEENDREKAALAELNWMNSLAGLKTSGTVDRVVTTAASPRFGESSLTQHVSSIESDVAQQTARQSSARSALRSPPTGSIPLSSTGSHGKARSQGEVSNEAGKASGGGFFDTLSTVWATAVDISPPTTSKPLSPVLVKDRRLSGQSKSRLAAQAALNCGVPKSSEESHPIRPGPQTTGSAKEPQKHHPSPPEQSKADNDWSW